MGYSWIKLTQDEFGREGAKQSFALALIVMMFAGVFAFILPALAAADSWTDTTTENFAQGTHENTENVDDNVRLVASYTQGSFTSRTFDAGQVVENWDYIIWNATTPSLTEAENDNVGAEPTQLIDGGDRIGENLNSFTYARDNDGVYENISEAGGGAGSPESGSPYLLIVQGGPEKGTSTWWGWVIVNPTDSEITVTEVRVKDNAGTDWNWAINVQGCPTSGWADGGANGLYWSGSESISAHSATYFRVRVTQGGVNETADHTMIWTVTGTENLEGSSVVVGIDRGSQGGMFYNKPGDTTEQTEAGTYPDALYAYLDVDENGDNLSAGTEYIFYVNIHEWYGKAIDPGGALTITIPKEFTGVALVDYADFSDAGVSGGGAEDWTIQGTNDGAIQNNVIHLSFKATTPSTYGTRSNWEFDTRFTGTGDKGETVRYICEAVVSVQASASVGYSLNWEHRIENVATGHDNYWVWVRGYTSGDSEDVGVYIWDNDASSWEFLDNLTPTEKTITKQIAGSSITKYLRGDTLSIKYEDYNTDGNQTTVHIDLCIVQAETVHTTEIKLQVATSADSVVWSDNLGPDGTTSTYFTTSPTSLENIGDNRYFKYIAYLSTEDDTITPVLHDVTINYVAPTAPSAPTPYLPADGTYTNDNTPYFEWTVGAKADNHRLLVDDDADFSSPEENVLLGSADNTYTISEPGLADDTYSWKVVAINAIGENESSTWTFVIDTIVPSIPTPYLPADGALTNDDTVYFEWSSIADAEYYDLFVDNDSDFSSPEVSVTITDNYYTSSAMPDENYSWRVRARDAANNVSDNSATWSFLIDSVAPSAPTPYLPADGTLTNDDTVYFEWSSIAGSEYYDLFVDNDSDFSSPEVSVTITDNYYTSSAMPDENYSWRVRARDAANNVSDNSATWTFLIDTIAPATTTLVSPENNVVENVLTQTFTWIEPEAGVTFDIQIDNETSFTSPYVNENNGLADNLSIYNFALNGVYYWRVRAVDAANNQSSWADNFKLTIQAPPRQPTFYPAADDTYTNDNTPHFEWTVGVNADNHRLLVDNDADFSSPEENVLLGATDNTYTISALGLGDENYSWKVIAINAFGENESSTWTFVIDTIAPSIPNPYLSADGALTNDNTVYFEWSSIADAENYDLFVDDDSDFSSPEISVTITDNYYTSSALPDEDENYFWRVRSRDAANNVSDNSATWTFLIDTVVPSAPTPYLSADGALTNDNTVYFEWSSIAGAENYDLFVDNDSDFSSPEVSVTITDNYYTSSALGDENYSWRVRARDAANNVSDNSATWTFLIDIVALTPTPYLPADGALTNDNTVYFEWSNVEVLNNYRLSIDNDNDFDSPEVKVTIIDDNYYTSSALPDESYFWKVQARSSEDNNVKFYSTTWTFLIDAIAPATPTLVSPGDNAVGNALTQTFKWTEPEAGVAYDIQIDNETSFTSPYVHENTGLADNSYIYTFASNSVYYWRVRAVDAANNQSSWTDNFKLSVQAPPKQPVFYLSTDGAYTNDNSPHFEWIVGANADNHRLLVDNDVDFSSPEENVLLGTTDNTYTISALGLADENYSWKVVAINAFGENESSTWTFVIDTIAPSIPNPYPAADGALTNDDTVYFEWSSIAGAENYDLFVDNDSDFSSPEVSVTITDNYYTSSTLGDENYSWRVRARDAANNVSDNSATWTFLIDTVAPSAPNPYLPADGALTNDDTVYFEWSNIADAENYDLFVDDDADFSSPEVSVTISDNYYTSSALGDENYSWRVRARDAANNVIDNSVTRTFLIDTTPVSSGDNDLTTIITVLPPLEGALSVTIGTITAGGTGSADFTRHAITVTGVKITATSDVSGARVDVVMHANKPARVTMIGLPVYIYFDLSTTVDGVYIDGATIRFRVPKSWIAEMDIDEGTIRLLRYNGTWQRLPTGMIGADSAYFHYEATMPGFSLFAIVGEPRVAPTSTPWGTPTVPPPTQAPPFLYAALFMSAGVFGLAMAYSFARPSRYSVILKRLKQLERELIKPGVRHIGLPLPEIPAIVPKRVSPAELAALRRLERIGLKKLLRERRS